RDAAEPRHLILLTLEVVLQQPADGEALAVPQLDRGVGAAHDQARNLRTGDVDDVGGIELTDFRLDLQVDHAVAEHRGREREPDAEFLEDDRDLAERARYRKRKFTAGQKARGVAGERDEVRLRQPPGDFTLFERADHAIDVHPAR